MNAHSYLNTENTRAIFPIARILFRITSFRRLAAVPGKVLHNIILLYLLVFNTIYINNEQLFEMIPKLYLKSLSNSFSYASLLLY